MKRLVLLILCALALTACNQEQQDSLKEFGRVNENSEKKFGTPGKPVDPGPLSPLDALREKTKQKKDLWSNS